jgi:mono/diheme cytochrome c family protein
MRHLVKLLLLALGTTSIVAAQAAAPIRTVWDGVYTEAQADRGMTVFSRTCAGCHALATQGRAPLVGDGFWKSFAQKTAGELLEYVSLNMPNGAPASLSEANYADIVAVMLRSNGLPSGPTELVARSVTDVQIIPKDGNTELPANALVRVVGCLTRSGADWVVTRATTPERAERVRAASEDAARPLGSRTMALKFVLTRLDAWAGARVLVNGLLIGNGGADGINVTTVNRVAEKCP